jgi:hypothetical protein
LSWGDADYSGAALAVLTEIVGRNAANIDVAEAFIRKTEGIEDVNISTAEGRGPHIVFTPSVFEKPKGPVEPDLVALMMPFEASFAGVRQAVVAACTQHSLRCQRVDDLWVNSTVIQDIFSLIFRSSVVVCDFTGRNPNVFYEAGIAHTLGKEVIPLTQDTQDVPFDLRHHRHLKYLNNSQGLSEMQGGLASRLGTVAHRQRAERNLASL